MAYSRPGDVRKRDAAQEASDEAILASASSACRHVGGIQVAARSLLTEPRSAGNEETWATLMAELRPEDHAAVFAAAAATVLASATEVEEGNYLP